MRLASDQDDFIAGRNALSTITNVNISLNNASDDFITKVYFTPSSGLGLESQVCLQIIGQYSMVMVTSQPNVSSNSSNYRKSYCNVIDASINQELW